MSKLVKFIKLPMKKKLMFIEVYIALGYARLAMLHKPFIRIAQKLGEANKETACSNEGIDMRSINQVSRVIKTLSKHTFWKSECLVQAYAAARLLRRRKQPYTVYMGVAKDENGKMIAHAWLRCGMMYVTGGNGSVKYTITNIYSG